MKKKVALILIIMSIPLYLWDSYVLFAGLFGSKKPSLHHAQAVLTPQEWTLSSAAAHFEDKGRSPFIAFKERPKPIESQAATAKKRSVKTSAIAVSAPKITITGIMWHPTNPIAMITLPDGSRTAVKTGQTVGSFQFKAIEKNRVLVVVEESEFWISK